MTDKKTEIELLRADLYSIESYSNFDHGNWMQNDALDDIRELFMKGFNRSPFKELFYYFELNNIDTGLFINSTDPDVDTFEQGKFIYLTQSDIFLLLTEGWANITYGLGFDSYAEWTLIDFEKEIIKILKKFKFKSIEREQNKFYGQGMQGNKVCSDPNFEFIEYFDRTEIEELRKMINSWYED